MYESSETCDLELRFKGRFEGFEVSGITLAMVWSTRMHGTRRRRAVKHSLHIFPTLLWLFLGVQSAQPDLRQQRTLCATSSFSVCFTNTFGKLCTALEPQAPTWWRSLNNNILIVTRGFNNHFHPRATPFHSDKEILSVRVSSLTSWGEFIV